MSDAQKIIKVLAIALALFIILAIVNALFLVITGLGVSNTKDYSYTFDNVNNINIDLSSVNMVIKKGERLELSAKGVSKYFKVDNTNNTLSIKDKSVNINNSEVILTIPNELDSFLLNMGAGKVNIENIVASKTSIDGGAGELVIKDTTFKDLYLDMGIGKTTFSGTLIGESTIDLGIGELILSLDSDDYKINAHKGIGSISINGEEINNDTIHGNGSNLIDVDGGIGNIRISMKA